ncbi:MAG: membrane protein insertase YidC, partial [Longimicrobiales bacterium]
EREAAAGLEPAGQPGVREPEATVVAVDTIVVTSPLYSYGISSAGGSIVDARLLEFRSFTEDGPVNLVPEGVDALVEYRLLIGDRTIELSRLPFTVRSTTPIRVDSATGERTLTLTHNDPETGATIDLTYAFAPDRYLIGVSGQVRGRFGDAPTLGIAVGPRLGSHEADPDEDARAAAYVVNGRREGIQSVSISDADARRVLEGPLYWTGFRGKYFLAAVISDCEQAVECFGGAIAEPTVSPSGVELVTTLPVGRDGRFQYALYLGPQEPSRLAQLGRDLQDVNPYGWQIFRPILRPLAHFVTWAVTEMHGVLDIGYGWVLILFGFLVRIVLWPLNAKAMRSQLKNMELQPVIQDLQKRHKNEPEKLQKEMLRLYREEGFNPLGGCLPMLIPFPVLITLYFVFQNTIEFRGVDFLWLADLSRPDPLYLLPILLGLSMFALQWLSARAQPTMNPQMKIMMWVMPGMITIFFFNLASGLNLYYFASNLASIPQQLQIMQERKRVRARMDG